MDNLSALLLLIGCKMIIVTVRCAVLQNSWPNLLYFPCACSLGNTTMQWKPVRKNQKRYKQCKANKIVYLCTNICGTRYKYISYDKMLSAIGEMSLGVERKLETEVRVEYSSNTNRRQPWAPIAPMAEQWCKRCSNLFGAEPLPRTIKNI